MKHIYILNSAVRGAEYGIGTYIKQLLSVINKRDFKVTVIKIIYSDVEFSVKEQKDVRYITIPAPVLGGVSGLGYDSFERSIPFMLLPYIDNNEDNIFHLNYIAAKALAESIKQYFRGRILMTVHYTGWSFSLLGDKPKLIKMLKMKEEKRDALAKSIIKIMEIEKKALEACDQVIAISKHSYDDLHAFHNVPKDKLTLINNALKDSNKRSISHAERSRLRDKFKIPQDDIVIVFAGRLDAVKGVDILIAAFKRLFDKHPTARIIIAGEGSFGSLFTEASPLWSRISFTGFLKKKELYELYSVADIGVVPSLHEEFGYVAVEMMMMQIPLVVSDSTGLSEIIDDEKYGLKAHVKAVKKQRQESIDSLADKISILIEDPQRRKDIVVAARSKYKKCYDLPLFRKKMLDIYRVSE